VESNHLKEKIKRHQRLPIEISDKEPGIIFVYWIGGLILD
jgi:hypothetical protein